MPRLFRSLQGIGRMCDGLLTCSIAWHWWQISLWLFLPFHKMWSFWIDVIGIMEPLFCDSAGYSNSMRPTLANGKRSIQRKKFRFAASYCWRLLLLEFVKIVSQIKTWVNYLKICMNVSGRFALCVWAMLTLFFPVCSSHWYILFSAIVRSDSLSLT